MNLKKIITVSATVLMMSSVGASISNVTSSPAHASRNRIARLVRQRNYDYRKAGYYSRQAKQLSAEIYKLNRANRRHYVRRHNNKHNDYNLGYIDGMNWRTSRVNGHIKTPWLHYHMKNNKSYAKGWQKAVYPYILKDYHNMTLSKKKATPARARSYAHTVYIYQISHERNADFEAK